MKFVEKVQTEEKRTYMENVCQEETMSGQSKVPPAPILLCRTDTFMVFKPAPFEPSTGQKVCLFNTNGLSTSSAKIIFIYRSPMSHLTFSLADIFML